MSRTYEAFEGEAETDLYEEIEALIKKHPWAWQSVCAVLGLAGGVIAPILGATADVITRFVHLQSVNSYLHVASILLCALTLPLLILGAFCLDLLESKTTNLSTPAEPPRDKATNETPARRVAQQNTSDRRHRTGTLFVVLVLLLALPATGHAQQTVFNVPTTDVLEAGHVYFELDISAKPVDPKFSSFVPRLVVGVGRRVEVGMNITGNVQPGPDSTTVVPAVKWKVYDGKDNGWAIAVGNNLFIPVRNKSYDAGTYTYTTIQKRFKRGTRVGFGGYFYSENVVAPHARRAGGQFTFEHPVTGRFGLQADWFTGKHANGYFTPGGYFKVTPKLTGYGAYSIGNGNASKGNHFLYFEMGYNFN
ncbi:MAG TPA: hypothetical protein VGC87_23675 [Pyrinomonadaceae bacterium]|jgi:hypothetical protein